MAKKVLVRPVIITNKDGSISRVMPGDEIPQALAKKIKNPAAWQQEEPVTNPAGKTDTASTALPPPPANQPGTTSKEDEQPDGNKDTSTSGDESDDNGKSQNKATTAGKPSGSRAAKKAAMPDAEGAPTFKP